MRIILAIVSVVFALGAASPAQAACDITVRFTNSGDTALTLLPEWARTRTRLGTWRRLWRDAEPVVVGAGETYARDFRARQCAWTVMRRFEFHIERDPRRYQGPTVTQQVLRGGVRAGRRNGPDAADVLTIAMPADGFLRTDSLDPADPDNAGRAGFEGDGMQLIVRDLAVACEAARNPG